MNRNLPPLHRPTGPLAALMAATLCLMACAPTAPTAPTAASSAARPGPLQQCTELAARFAHPRTQISGADWVPEGKLKVAGQAVPEHCLVSGRMNERTSPVDGQSYAIGFQMRLPKAWNGRFFHQGNGGLDGFVTDALGPASGGGPLSSALQQGFAVLSSDAGHTMRQLPLFGRDPQARLDYGYQAVGTLTPMARQWIASAYGRAPDRPSFGGRFRGRRCGIALQVLLAFYFRSRARGIDRVIRIGAVSGEKFFGFRELLFVDHPYFPLAVLARVDLVLDPLYVEVVPKRAGIEFVVELSDFQHGFIFPGGASSRLPGDPGQRGSCPSGMLTE